MKILMSLILTACLMGCVSTPAAAPNPVNMNNFADGAGKDWKLLEISIESAFNREIVFDRKTLVKEGSGEIFTMKFDAEMISGVAAPNRYSGPYTLGENRAITLTAPMRSTLMASLFQPEKLPEHEFFGYMQNIYEWRPANGNLEFLSKTENGREVRIIFGQ
ncbi:MAG: META domain-containing protein [Treponema sp.]|nr:META domain-containing protein [Treponema sp.]MCL2251800.1 META domain-containing protein [Treponema sp.]